jgi:DNA-binding NarL/FixJ family response regulator
MLFGLFRDPNRARNAAELEPDLMVVGEAEDGVEAIELTRVLNPDVVVMDVEMPGLDGIRATERLREPAPLVAVVVLSTHNDTTTKARACAAGALASVEKQGSIEALLQEIRRVAQ